MDKNKSIVLTGAAGFIGSCMLQFLNENDLSNIVLVDQFNIDIKRPNWVDKKFKTIVEREVFFDWLKDNALSISCIIHLGARTDTTEFDYSIHEKLNVEYSKKVWEFCTETGIPLIYASSAATYGDGELGYEDNHEVIEYLTPLNPYGISKNEFDKWALKQENPSQLWAGLKFFNIYGPNEGHKGRMASVIWHAFNQIKQNGQMKLFKSHRPDFEDGEQLRDFVYVKDVTKVIFWIMTAMIDGSWTHKKNGIYNLGTGKARSFYDLVRSTFKGMDLEPQVFFIDMPEDIRDKYQYYTQAKMEKLINVGYKNQFYTLEEGVNDYVRNYLVNNDLY